jgi:hypothetical protein
MAMQPQAWMTSYLLVLEYLTLLLLFEKLEASHVSIATCLSLTVMEAMSH